LSEVPITFDRSDHLDFVSKSRRYSLIVCPIVKDVKLNRVLVDGGSFLNILFLNTFDQMRLSRSMLCPSRAPFHGIVPGVAATPFGQIALPVTFRTQENFCKETIQFEVTNFKTVYNTFLGRSTLSKFMEIPHYAYLVLKMPGPRGIISIRGDIKQAFDCDRESCEIANGLTTSTELQELKQALAESPPDLVMPEAKTYETSIQPEDTLNKTIPLSMEEPSKVAHIGNSLDPKWELMLIKFIQENRDIFTWKLADMPGVPRKLIEHELHLDPKAKPVEQRLHHFTQDKKDVIKKEITRLLDDYFIKEVYHLNWLTNPILVSKKNKDWRMCVDYIDLNKACKKDFFGLPRIDQVVDSTAGCSLLSFLDCYSRYHQIPLKEEDQTKTSFITLFGAFCYTTMSFGLKSAGATYERGIQWCLYS
jgi:hypothetical protein